MRFQTSGAGTLKGALWINDDYFAVTESADESIGKEARIAIYNAQTLEPDRYIEGSSRRGNNIDVESGRVRLLAWKHNESLGFES